MLLSIITVTYYSKYVIETIENIRRECGFPVSDYEIIIVDNASQPLIQEYAQKNSLIYIKNKRNLGFGAAMNKGIQHAKGEYIALLNPDILITKQTFPTIITYLKKNKNVGIIGPKLLAINNALQYSCKRFPDILTLIIRRFSFVFLVHYFRKRTEYYEMHDYDHATPQHVDWLSGAFLVGRKEVFTEFLFDERFFLYFEDVDICRRIGQKYDIMYFPNAVATHYAAHGSKKSAKLFFYHLSSMMQYFYKYK